MVMYYIDRSFKIAYESLSKRYIPKTVASQEKAINLLIESLKGNVTLGGVQGPPGTGKTSVVELGTRRIVHDIISSREKILVIYVAPTNHLVIEAFTRFIAQLFREGYSISQVLELVRIYGSRIAACSSKSIKIGDTVVDCNRFKELMSTIDPNTVRFVFATEYQRVAPKITREPDEIRYIVDEASKTPFFRVFLGIAQKIIRQPEAYYPRSMIVLGDPEQAITVQEEFRKYRIKLLMYYVRDRLKRLGLEKHYVFLDTTFRLPAPTEEPISIGFYEGKLRALESFYIRYDRYLSSAIGGDAFNIVRRRLSKLIDIHGSVETMVVNGIEEALSSRIPILVFRTKRFPSGDTYEPLRAKIAFISSLYLSILSSIAGGGEPLYRVGVTAPYSDLSYSVDYSLKKVVSEESCRSAFIATTVQAIIGGEADIIVTMLGKEWNPIGLSYGYSIASYDIYYETMYFREHQVLNVQLSRHRLLMIMIGDNYLLEKTAKSLESYKPYAKAGQSISRTMETINDTLYKRGYSKIVDVS